MAVTRIPIPAWAKNQKADDRPDLSLAEIGGLLGCYFFSRTS
jgi:hypothetical protein